MLKAYKYRIYPNNEQKIQIAKTYKSGVKFKGRRRI